MDFIKKSKPVIIKLLLAPFLYLSVGLILVPLLSLSSSDWTNVKTVGGGVAECSETSPELPNSQQPLNLKVILTNRMSSVFVSDFEIQFVTCKVSDRKYNWSALNSIKTDFSQKFKDELGQVQTEKITFEKYRVVVTDRDGKVLQTIPVDVAFNIKFKIRVNSLDISKDPKTKTKYIDVSLVADRIRQTSSDRFFEEVNWGRYRLQLL